MSEPAADHLDHLSRAGYSRATITERARVLAQLSDPLGVDRERLQAWWATRATRPDGQPRARSSLSSEASHLREFWRWAMQQGLIDRNPADWLPKIRQKKTMATYVPEGDLDRLMHDAPDDMRRMLALASMAGLRSAEIAAVTWADIDRTNGVLWVRGGKGEKDRSVPLSAGLLVELGDPGDGLIVGRRMTPKAVSAAIGRYMRAHGSDYTAHKLRARFATRFHAATGDLLALAEVLGHADLTSVQRYAVATSDTKRRGAEAAGRIG